MFEGLSIILDKSSLQMLSSAEIETLSRYYNVVLPPILVTEIMGDLYSKNRNSTSNDDGVNEKAVQVLAKKIITHSACKNMDYKDMCIANLLGEVVCSRFRPCISPTKAGTNCNGETIAVIDVDAEMQMIHNWQNGNFTGEDERYAKAWKESQSQIDLNSLKAEIQLPANMQASTLQELMCKVDAVTQYVDDQWALVNGHCDNENLGVSTKIKEEIANRWMTFFPNRIMFREFAPFAYYCYLVRTVFWWGLANDLIPSSRRDKAYVDLQYAYYFQHARVFSSNDKLHKKLWETFGNQKEQIFVSGAELKEDLQQLDAHWQGLSEKEKNELRTVAPHPPVLSNSFTNKAYEKMVALGAMASRECYSAANSKKRTKEEEESAERVIARSRVLRED